MIKRLNNGNGDVPGWVRGLTEEIKAFIHEIREDRKQAVEDREQAAEDRRQAAEDRRQAAEDRKVFARAIVAVARVGLKINEQLQGLKKGQENQTRLLHQILQTLRIQGNGRGQNGNSRRRT